MSWTCKKNQSVCLSSIEAEYKAITSAAKEAVWDQRCLADMGQKQLEATELRCNNMGAITLSNNHVFHSRIKHVEIHHYYIRDVVEKGEISLTYVKMTDNLADILTKSLLADTILRQCKSMNLVACGAEKGNQRLRTPAFEVATDLGTTRGGQDKSTNGRVQDQNRVKSRELTASVAHTVPIENG